jgi:transcription elongation factor GreA
MHLVAIERPNASKAIGEAREKGDLSENAEYDAAKEAQGLLELTDP